MARVLVVEDSPTQAQQMVILLEEAGFAVRAVPDAEEAFAVLGKERFDIVLTDLVLPGESGFDLCRRLKADPRRFPVPIVVLTSQADPVNVLRGLEAGADGFMTKDREPREIIGRLRRTLEKCPPAPHADDAPPTRVMFLDCEFEIAVGRDQLLNVLLAAFEDVVHLNGQYQSSEARLRKVNSQLQESLRSEHEAYEQLKVAQSQLVQAEKLSGLGQMVAGVAHEINNPLTFLSTNITVLQRDTQAMNQILALYRQAEPALEEKDPTLLARIREYAEQMDLPYILSNLEGLLGRSRDGLVRIEKIVKGLREFARMEGKELKAVDLNQGIESTMDILRGEAKKRGVILNVELGALPPVSCFTTKINQVVLNLVSNALDACTRNGTVTVRTCPGAGGVEIHVIDDGCGIDPAIRDKVFDPFFTTKPVGKGTGLGLSISYGIVQDHGGRLTFDSAPRQGTHFVMWLPLRPPIM